MSAEIAGNPTGHPRTAMFDTVVGWLPPRTLEWPANRPALFLCLRVVTLLAVFMLVDGFMMRAGRIPTQGYEQPYLVVELLQRLGLFRIAALLVLAAVLAYRGRLLARWNALEYGAGFRWFVVFLTALIAWPFTTHGYNYYFDQGHYLDRALIAALVPLVYWRPVFIYPFLLLVFTTMWQLALLPGGWFVFPHKLQVLHVLNLFAGVFLIHAATGIRRMDGFVFFTCCLVAASYWQPALSKIELGWLTYGHLYRMPLAAYAHGWLAFLEPETVVSMARAVSWFDWPMRLFVLVIEVGCLFFLWRRTVSITLLLAVMLFHLGVFALYGYLFWTWISLDAALLVLLLRDRRSQRFEIHSRAHLAVSVVLIAFASHWCNPPNLAWYDTPITYTYRYEAVGESGRRYTLPPRFFSPYGDIFTMAHFGYIVADHNRVAGPYGVSKDRAMADQLNRTTTAEQVFALEKRSGASSHDVANAERYFDFLRRYVANWNLRGTGADLLKPFRAPAQFWSFGRGDVFQGEEPIRELSVVGVTTLFDGERLAEIRVLELARLQIPRGDDGAARRR